MQLILEKGQSERTIEENEALMKKSVIYVQFEELKDFEDDHLFKTNLTDYMENDLKNRMANAEEWDRQFEAINFLRIKNKYHIDILMTNIGGYTTFIKESIENLRSGISKNALMFTSEFFDNLDTMNDPKH